MQNNSLAVIKNNDVYSETKNYQTKLKSRKNSIQSYNDTFINNYYQTKIIKNPTTLPHIITKTNRIDSAESITIKITSENDKVDTTKFVTTEDIISSPVSSTFEDDKTPTSIFLSPTISKLVNDINDTLYERVTAIKNRNNELNKEILERITKFRNNQHELILNLINKFENNIKKADSSSNINDHPRDTNNDKTEEDNNKKNTEEDKKKLYDILLNIKKENMEFLNTIDTNLIYNINLKYASDNYSPNDQDVIFFTNSNGENKTILYQQINEEVFTDNDELKTNDKEQKENKIIESDNNTSIEALNDPMKKPTIERLIINTDYSNIGSTTSISLTHSPIKRFMKMTGICRLPYINATTKQSSSDADLASQCISKEKKNKKSLFKKKDLSEDNLKAASKKQNKNESNKYLMPSRECNSSIESFNLSSNSLNSLSSVNIDKKIHSNYDLKSYTKEKNKREGKTHKKCHSETLNFGKTNTEFITPLPMSNADSREHKRWSSVPSSSDEENLKEKKLKEKERKKEEKEKKLKEKERKKEEEKEKKLKEKEKKKEEEKEKKIKEKEKELEKKKKKNPNLYKTNSILEIQRRMKNVFDNYQVKLLGREPGAHPILNHEIADKILPNITPSAFKEYRNWHLLYSLEYHGSHPQTMYDAVNEKTPLVLAVMDEDGCIFGAYCTEFFHIDTHYYGNGQTFLWKYEVDENKNGQLKIFRATGSNHYYIISEKSYLAFGGGKGFGLHITDEFTYGFTDNCETYNNEVLACKKEFKCINMEVWCLEL